MDPSAKVKFPIVEPDPELSVPKVVMVSSPKDTVPLSLVMLPLSIIMSPM